MDFVQLYNSFLNGHLYVKTIHLDCCMVELNSNGMPADDIFQVILNLCPGKGWTLEDVKTRYSSVYCMQVLIRSNVDSILGF